MRNSLRPSSFAIVAFMLLTVLVGEGAGVARGRGALEKGPHSVAHRSGARKVQGTNDAPRAVVSRTGSSASEPTLGLTKKGRLFYVAIHDNLRVEVLRSNDEGRSWTVASPKFVDRVNAQLVSFDPYLYVDQRTDRVFTIDLTVLCSYLSYSDDGGESWTTNPLACGRPINDHQTLFAGPPTTSAPRGYENVVYYCWNDVATSSCSKSLDGGLTFMPSGAPAFLGYDPDAEGGGLCGGLHGHGVVDRDGIVYLPRYYCNRPVLAISRDEGATWKRVQVANNGTAFTDPSVDVDARGNIYYGWVAKNRLPYLSISRDRGRSWSKPMMIAAPGVAEANLLTIDVAKPGRVALAYMGTRNERHPKTWNGYLAMTVDGLRADPLFYTAAVNFNNDPLKRGACGPGRCGEQILDFIDVVIAPDGTPYASFVDACDHRCVRSGTDNGNEGIVGRLVGGPRLD